MERVSAFGQNYRSLKSLAIDPRCIVPYQTLRYRYKVKNWTAEDAAKISKILHVWDQIFPTLQAVANDPMCEVSYETLQYRCSVNVPLHIAVQNHEVYLTWKTANA